MGKEELEKWRSDYAKLAKEIKLGYDSQQKEKAKAWQDEVKEYMARDKWQEYVKECKTLKIPVKSMLNQKKKVQKKLANGMVQYQCRRAQKRILPSRRTP